MSSKPLLRAQFYHDEAKKLRDMAATEEKESRRQVLLEIAESFDELAAQVVAEIRGHTDK